MLGLALHRLFADETSLAIEARMATAGQNASPRIADYRQFRPAAGYRQKCRKGIFGKLGQEPDPRAAINVVWGLLRNKACIPL
jgi:hypothetical protein